MDVKFILDILAMIISGILSIVVAYFGKKMKKEAKKREQAEENIAREEKALRDGIKAILRDRLLQIGTVCRRKESITVEELESITGIFRAYTTLGGNGAAKKIYEDTMKLPVKKEH